MKHSQLIPKPEDPIEREDQEYGYTRYTFQARVGMWIRQCFGSVLALDKTERNHRFLEESIELGQACGCTREEAHQLVDYVFNREKGEPLQEIGGVMTTLHALANAHMLNVEQASEVELKRVWNMIPKIRAKRAMKPDFSPLP